MYLRVTGVVRKKVVEIELDKLTNSIVNVVTGEVFETECSKVTLKEIKKRNGYLIGPLKLKIKKVQFLK